MRGVIRRTRGNEWNTRNARAAARWFTPSESTSHSADGISDRGPVAMAADACQVGVQHSPAFYEVTILKKGEHSL